MRNSRKQIHQRTRMRDSSYRNPPARLRNLEPRNLNKMPQAKRTQKRIGLAIIGAGPSGMAAAITAANRGHSTTYNASLWSSHLSKLLGEVR